jgi:hypothetical protein
MSECVKMKSLSLNSCFNVKFKLPFQPFKQYGNKKPFLKYALKNLRTQRILLPNEFKVEVMLNSAQRFSLPRGTQTVGAQEDDKSVLYLSYDFICP